MFCMYLSQCFSDLRSQKILHWVVTAVLSVVFVSLTLNSSGIYIAFLVFGESSVFSAKDRVTMNTEANGRNVWNPLGRKGTCPCPTYLPRFCL